MKNLMMELILFGTATAYAGGLTGVNLGEDLSKKLFQSLQGPEVKVQDVTLDFPGGQSDIVGQEKIIGTMTCIHLFDGGFMLGGDRKFQCIIGNTEKLSYDSF